MRYLLLIIFFINYLCLQGQNIFIDIQKEIPGEGKVTIYQEENTANLLLNRIDEIKRTSKIPGFRINIFWDDSQNARDKAQQARAKFLGRYNMACYYEYEAPYSKLYVGDFRNRSEAQKALKIIQYNFPKAFIKPDMINLPDLD